MDERSAENLIKWFNWKANLDLMVTPSINVTVTVCDFVRVCVCVCVCVYSERISNTWQALANGQAALSIEKCEI